MKVLIFIISYKASFRLLDVYKKIPFKKIKKYDVSILFSDDASKDDTMIYARKIKQQNKDKKIIIKENKINLGYGGNIKSCLNFSLKKNIDYAIMIHGDGQFDPKYIPDLLNSITKNKNVGASTGSRLKKGIYSASKGGMPFYKLLGNILLTKIFNLLLNVNFSDAHTGMWAYNLKYLKNKKFNKLTNGFNFDQEFRFKNILENKKITEIAIKTKYGDERSQLHIKYALNFFLKSIKFFLMKKKIINTNKFI